MPTFAKRFLFIAAGVLVAAAIALLCVNLYLQSGGVQQRIRDAAARSLGAEVKIRSAVYTPWSGFVLRGLNVPDPTNANLNIVEATALRVRFSLVPLLNRRFVITECTLFEPKLIVRQLENGDWFIPMPPARIQVPEASSEPSLPVAKGATFKAELQHFRLRGGNVVFLNAKNRAIVTLDRTDIRGQIALDSSAAGTFEIGKADFFSWLKPRKIGGPFTWDGKILDLPGIQGSLAGGKLIGKCRVESNEQPSFVLGLQLTGVLLRKLAEEAQLEPGKTEGVLQGSVDLAGDPRNSDSITGTGHFELVSAKLTPVDFLVKLGKLLQIDELQLLKLSDARVDVTIRDERVQVDDIVLRSDNLILRGKGPVRFNGKMNLDAQLLFNLKLQHQLRGVLGKNLVDSEDPEYRQIPFTVTGRIDNPKTDLLDKLIGAKVGQDVGGMLMNILRSSVPQKSEDKTEEKPREIDPMRVIAGEARGLPLITPSRGVRPTMDRVRGAIFSSLGDAVPGARVLDLFAGSGAMGIEALSRGAVSAVFVDSNPRCAACVRENLRRARLEASVQVMDALKFLELYAEGSFDLIFADPPYAKSSADYDFAMELLRLPALVGALRPSGTFVLERLAGSKEPEAIALSLVRVRCYGESEIAYYVPAQ